jgi:hypothetical protein
MLRIVLIAASVALAVAPGSAVAGPEEGDFVFAPPPWYYEGRATLIARGGTCEESTRSWRQGESIPGFPTNGERAYARTEDCEARIPVEVMKAIGGNPVNPFDPCMAGVIDAVGDPLPPASPTAEQENYLCAVAANPGTDATPNTTTWRCHREQYRTRSGEFRDDAHWRAERSKVFHRALFTSLEDCLAPRVRVERSRARRPALKVTCSHACTVRASLVAGSATLGRGHNKAQAGAPVNVRLKGGGTAGSRLRVRVNVRADGRTQRARIPARVSGGRLRFARTTLEFGEPQ